MSRARRGCPEHAFREARADAGLVRRVCALCGAVEMELDLRSGERGTGRWRRFLRRLLGVLRGDRPASSPTGPVCDHCDRRAAIRTRDGFLCARCAIEQLPEEQRPGRS